MREDEGDGWLFLTAGPDQKETLQPLISAWMGWAVQSLKAMSEVRPPRARMWFICDELPQLKYLPTLEDALAEIRGFGGCFAAGTQDYHQLQKLYGIDSTHTLLTLFNTKIVFRCPDKKTASYMAEGLGEHDTRERSEGISFGAHDMRDGVTLNEQKKTQTIVRPSDLMKLPKLQAYLQVPGDFPPVHLQFEYQKAKAEEPWFVPLPNQGKKDKKNENIETSILRMPTYTEKDRTKLMQNIGSIIEKKDENIQEGNHFSAATIISFPLDRK